MSSHSSIQNYSSGSNNLMNKVFGPLPKQYCLYFYILSIIGFSLFVCFVLYLLYTMLTSRVKKDSSFYIMGLSTSASYLLIYFTYRILYSMCAGSLQ